VTWIQLRSRRDPAVWGPLLLTLLAMAAIVLWVQTELDGRLEALEATADSDPEGATSQAVRLVRWCEVALCTSTLLFTAFLARFFQLAGREGRLPPSGWWSLGAWRVLVGPEARRLSRLGLSLTLLLPALTAATIFVTETLLRSLLAR